MTSATNKDLRIVQGGLCCAVGFNLPAAYCAMRAGMDHFQESAFRDVNGKPLQVARLPLGDLWGEDRMAVLAATAVCDCLSRWEAGDARLGVVLLAAEPGRPHQEPQRYAVCQRAIDEALPGLQVMARATYAEGRAGLASGLVCARAWLASGEIDYVLLVGVDSYLNAATVNHLIGTRRMLTTDTPAGFIPGEAAAAIVLGRPLPEDAGAMQVLISGVGAALEEGRPDGKIPNRATGLTQALRAALKEADLAPDELDFRITDHNGDPFLAAESALMHARLMAGTQMLLPMINPAESIGEVGAALGVAGLAYGAALLAREHIDGPVGVLHMSNDDGRRAAVVIERI
ncbi:hypothetical protein [Paraburkholderia bannensis]|uniref:hypothetical protein n=1 Tax=Paraburkholderia bannensis TaxID=765414 RepID=UPI002AB66290|nr:hypothetical protein [Paraburkholderia bannensis]